MNSLTLKVLTRSIKQSLGRFISITAIVALGVGFYAGLTSSQPAMMTTASDYMSDTGMYDFQLLSTLGFTEQDTAQFRKIDSVTYAETACFCDALMIFGTEEKPWHVMSLTRQVSTPLLTSGKMPVNPDECLADSRKFSEADIGRKIYLSFNNGDDVLEMLPGREYTITGLASSPRYLSFDRGSTSLGSGKIEGFIIVPIEAFESEAGHELLISCGLNASFSDEYDNAIEQLEPEIIAELADCADRRYAVLRSDADRELAKARKELDDGWDEYNEGKDKAEKEFADAEKTLAQASYEIYQNRLLLEEKEQEISDGLAQLPEAEKTLAESREMLDAKKKELDEAKAQLQQGEQELQEGKEQLELLKSVTLGPYRSAVERARSQVQETQNTIDTIKESGSEVMTAMLPSLETALAEEQATLEQAEAALAQAEEQFAEDERKLAEGEAELAAARAQIENGEKEIDNGYAQLEAGEKELEENRKLLAEGAEQIESGKKELQTGAEEIDRNRRALEIARKDAQNELDEALKKLEDGEREYADAQAEVDDMLRVETYCLGRSSNSGCVTFRNDTSIVTAASKAFPVFFILIAALVCVTTMTRMINEERVQIGTMKALGYSKGAIISKYAAYSGLAALTGCLLGFALGITVIPYIVWIAYGILYTYTALQLYFSIKMCLLCLGISVPGIVLVTLFACGRQLNEKPAELMRPKTPAVGRRILLERITPLWKRFPFLTKVMLRNAFRRPVRVAMMLVGIGGCTALMIAGFGVKDSIADMMDYQYSEVFCYDMTVNYDSEDYPHACDIEKLWEGKTAQEAAVYKTDAEISNAQGTSRSVNLIAAEGEELNGIINFHDASGQLEYPGPGCVLLTTKIAEILDAAPGDTLTIKSDDFGEISLTVSGIADNYTDKYVYMLSSELENTAPNTALLRVAEDVAASDLAVSLRSEKGIEYVSLAEDEKTTFSNSMKSLGLLIILIVSCSGALAFITIYNLTNINIMERTREIATVKVLGFRPEETSSYILKENMLLSIMGAFAGLPLGKLLHLFIMELIHVEYLSYDIRISPYSYLWSFCITLLFSILTNYYMHFRLEGINMAESLKSVE